MLRHHAMTLLFLVVRLQIRASVRSMHICQILLSIFYFPCADEDSAAQIGFEPKDRGVLDLARYWTMVARAAFSKDGEISQIEIYSGAAGRRLRIGIYRPNGGNCQFQLVQQKEWSSFPVGLNKVIADSALSRF